MATEAELLAVHSREYLDAVRRSTWTCWTDSAGERQG
jgi:hypothetical protein